LIIPYIEKWLPQVKILTIEGKKGMEKPSRVAILI
tara:strand:+ start:53 stop:157 length:105 start_codon:yes stop_codon:yes gene_type:complete